MKQRDAELVDMQAKLRNTEAKLYELVVSRNQQVGEYEKERVNVRAKLEAKESELEAIHGRGEGLDQEQSRGRLGQHYAGSVNRDEDQVTRRLWNVCEPSKRKWCQSGGTRKA